MQDINYGQLQGEQNLPDGDVIKAEEIPGIVPENRVSIALKLSGVTWWKGIQSGAVVLCQCQDNQSYISTQIDYDVIKKDGLQFWKAKAFGVHTQMYQLTDVRDHLKPGKGYIFTWRKD